MLLQFIKTIKNVIDVSERAFRITFFRGKKKKREIRFFLSKIILKKCLTTYTHTRCDPVSSVESQYYGNITAYTQFINLYTDSVLLKADIFAVVAVFY